MSLAFSFRAFTINLLLISHAFPQSFVALAIDEISGKFQHFQVARLLPSTCTRNFLKDCQPSQVQAQGSRDASETSVLDKEIKIE